MLTMSIWETLVAAFSYGFMIRALLVGITVAASSAFIGSFLVLKKFSMIGHGLSHVAFAAVAIALVLNQAPLPITAVIVVLVSVLILKLNETAKLHGDAAIGLAATFSMALGTTLASVGGGFNIELNRYLFGTILAIRNVDVWMSVVLSFAVVMVVTLFYADLFAMTYDEEFAKVSGIKTKRLNTLLAILTGLVIALGIRAIGAVLISAFIIFPTVIAMQFSKGFKTTVVLAATFSMVIVFIGLLLSFVLDTPSGSSIVLLNGLVFTLVYAHQRILRK